MLTLDATSSRFTITRPTTPSEFEIQAFIFWSLKSAGFDVRGEVVADHDSWSRNGRERKGRCRFDLVIFDGEKAIQIIEVKESEPTRRARQFADTRQPRRYVEYGVPVTFIRGMEQAEKFVADFCK